MAQKLSALPIGAKIKLLTFLGAPVEWRVIGRNLTDMPANSTTLFMDKIVAQRCFDAQEPNNSDRRRGEFGNNDWGVSNLRQWANSSASAGNWYSAQHATDAPPDTAAHCHGYNAYQADKGFLAESTAQERDLLLSTTRNYGGWSANGKTCVDKLFALTTNELGFTAIASNGTKIPYFTSKERRTAYCTAQCIADSEYKICGTSNAWYYWTATSFPDYSHRVQSVYTGNEPGNYEAYYGAFGVRLACNIFSDTLVSDSTDADGCYAFILNQPPTGPQTLTVPSTIRSTKSINIEWSAGNDPEGNLSGYILQRKLDSGSWGEIYRGSQRSYVDTVAYGSLSVQYRVQAYDDQGQVSAWTTSGVRAVINNQPPQVAGGQIDNQTPGMKPPKWTYTVTDEDSETVTVTEYIDGTQIKSGQAELGQEATLECPEDTWLSLPNGEHVYKAVATDDRGDMASASATFEKKVESVDFVLKNPMAADERPTAAVLNVQGSFPEGCELKVELCNNGNDEEPTWVDVTEHSKSGLKVIFENQDKTAEQWGVGLRVHLARGEAEGPVNIISLGGNYQ